jgi:methyl-accepting chemotaxis protein
MSIQNKSVLIQSPGRMKRLKCRVLIILALILVLITFSLKYLNSRFENEIIQKNEILTSRLAEKVEHFLNKSLTLISKINHNIQKKKYLPTKDLNKHLSICIKEYDLFNMMKILDEKGIVTHIAPFDEQLIGSDQFFDKYFQKTMEEKTVFWSPSFISSHTGLISSTLNFPISNGVIACDINLSILNEIIDNIPIGKSGYALLTDNYGILIAHGAGEFLLMKSNAKFLFHDLQKFEEGKGTVQHRIRGVKIFSSMDVVSPMNWRIIVNQPIENIFVIIIEHAINFLACIIIGIMILVFVQARSYQTS